MSSLLEIAPDYELDFHDDYSFEEENSPIESNQNSKNIISFYNELEPIIGQCIKNYFSDHVLHDGREIPNSLLELSYYSSLVFNTTVSDGVLKAYFLMEECNFLSSDEICQNSIGEEIRYMIDLLSDIQRRVPQEFVGGMILMHLELVEGIEIW